MGYEAREEGRTGSCGRNPLRLLAGHVQCVGERTHLCRGLRTLWMAGLCEECENGMGYVETRCDFDTRVFLVQNIVCGVEYRLVVPRNSS